MYTKSPYKDKKNAITLFINDIFVICSAEIFDFGLFNII
jgi:hypothetical protein